MQSPTRLLVVASVAFALLAPMLQALTGWGLTAAQFSAAGDQTLRASGYAFSIWGPLYAGIIAYAAYQALPASDASPLRGALAWPSIVAILGCGAWICAAALNLRWATVIIITTAAMVLTLGLVRAAPRAAIAPARDTLLVLWPLAALAGWLTIASAINLLTVLTAEGLIGGEQAQTAGLVGLGAIFAVGAGGLWLTRSAVYGLPLAWGLVGVWAAERAGHPTLARTALGLAILVGVSAVVVAARWRR